MLTFKVYESRQSEQKVVDPEHSVHGDSHRLHSVPTLVNPDGQFETHDPSKNNPLAHEQTPLTDLVPAGQVRTHSPLEMENPLKQV